MTDEAVCKALGTTEIWHPNCGCEPCLRVFELLSTREQWITQCVWAFVNNPLQAVRDERRAHKYGYGWEHAGGVATMLFSSLCGTWHRNTLNVLDSGGRWHAGSVYVRTSHACQGDDSVFLIRVSPRSWQEVKKDGIKSVPAAVDRVRRGVMGSRWTPKAREIFDQRRRQRPTG